VVVHLWPSDIQVTPFGTPEGGYGVSTCADWGLDDGDEDYKKVNGMADTARRVALTAFVT
jgi:hypothetical protein